MSPARCSINVHGLVQGVGFRPFVHGLARRFALDGFVRNAPSGVHIEVEGAPAAIAQFMTELRDAPPSEARVAHVESFADTPRGEPGFHILTSTELGAGGAWVPADRATCEDCLRELFDAKNRRFLHPFVTCTQCGPRASIITGMPYDRERTTMADFTLCASCAAEYEAPEDRRFHAQPIACKECGPVLELRGDPALEGEDPIEAFAAELASGRIGALKGIGGFHLVCDAANEASVGELRRRKRRDAKPFAVMVPNFAVAAELCHLDEALLAALSSRERPIVVAPRREGVNAARIAPSVAPGVGTLGLILPYTPIHYLLFRKLGERPLVMTSGNTSEEPIARTNAEAFSDLGGITDVFLTHDRDIRVRMEDSILAGARGRVFPLRRSRGYAPSAIEVPFEFRVPTLALGGHMKAAFAFGVGGRAVLGPHAGDLDGLRAYSSYTDAIAHFERLLGFHPERLVHDAHPDYASSRYARERAEAEGIELVAVQHHHAHLASCMADNGLSGVVIGVCFDGTGLGTDGGLWGGEFLVGGYTGFERAAHLSKVPLPGGDRAAREPFRVAVSHLMSAGVTAGSVGLERRIDPHTLRAVAELARKATACPETTSMGRLFDAVASIAGVADRVSYEGESGMRLEALARKSRDTGTYAAEILRGKTLVVDTGPLIVALANDVRLGVDAAVIARRFHTAVVDLVENVCVRLRMERGLSRVALSGGVFANGILADEVPTRLTASGFSVFSHTRVPPNDGGICLGQLAIAAHCSNEPALLLS